MDLQSYFSNVCLELNSIIFAKKITGILEISEPAEAVLPGLFGGHV